MVSLKIMKQRKAGAQSKMQEFGFERELLRITGMVSSVKEKQQQEKNEETEKAKGKEENKGLILVGFRADNTPKVDDFIRKIVLPSEGCYNIEIEQI